MRPPLSLQEVEQATGLTREVLRKWELRYQFPNPIKGSRGERLYLAREVDRLRLLGQLVNRGIRISHLMPLSTATLHHRLTEAPQAADPARVQRAIPELLRNLNSNLHPDAPHEFLHDVLRRKGLPAFIEHCVPAFNQAIGQSWQEGSLGVHGERRYSNAIRQVLLQSLPNTAGRIGRARVLLTTPPGEMHELGLMTLHSALALQGAGCFNLGTQLPVQDIAHAVRDWDIAVVAVSVSSHYRIGPLRAYVSALIDTLPPTCGIWLGGGGAARMDAVANPRLRVYASVTHAAVDWSAL